MISELSDGQLEEYDFYLQRSELPPAWAITTLQDVSHVITDGTHKTPNYVESGVRFISIKNIKPFQPVNFESYEKYISREQHNDLIRRCNPQRDDILFPRIGTLGYAKRIDFDEEVSLFVGLGLVKPIKECVLPKYIEYYLNTPYISALSKDKANGSGRMTLPLEESRKFPIPLPPLAEQARIVAKIDELLSELDDGHRNLSLALRQLKVYRQAILKNAFEGKLSESWRMLHGHAASVAKPASDEHCENAVALNGSNGRRLRKSFPAVIGSELERLPMLPASWTWERLAHLFPSSPKNGVYKPASLYGSGTAIIRIDDFYEGSLARTTGFKQVALDAAEVEVFAVRNGDIIINRVNSIEYLGKCAFVEALEDDTVFESNIMNCGSPGELFEGRLLVQYLSSEIGRRRLCINAKHAVNQASINQTDVGSTIVPVPPREEQAEIARILDRVLSHIDSMSTDVTMQIKRVEALRRSILKRAFSGQLVAQNPCDEPASTVLARLAAGRSVREQTKRRNTKNGKKEAA